MIYNDLPFNVNWLFIVITHFTLKMSEDGYVSSVRELFEDSAVEDCVPDETFGSGVASSISVGLRRP